MRRAFQEAEELRLHCLQQMGISSYYPRFLLLGALPSPVLPQQDTHTTEAAALAKGAAGTLAPAEAARAVSALAPLVASAGESSVAAELQAPVPTGRTAAQPVQGSIGDLPPVRSKPLQSTSPGAAASEVLQFQLLLLHIDAELAVLVQIPALARPALQQRQAALLQNMLRWLGLPIELSPQPRRFQWPLPGMKSTEGAAAAALGLRHFVEQAVLEQPFRGLLLLGQQLAEQLGAADFAPAGLPFICTHSLDELLAVPALKREAWLVLQPLHAVLQKKSA
jgi:hypothetical protein